MSHSYNYEATIKNALHDAFPLARDASSFAAMRSRLCEMGGAQAMCSELEGLGFVAHGKLTTGTKPFNVFARVMSGALVQPGMHEETAALGSERFMIACNRPENDEHWDSSDEEWVGKASMGERHRFMLVRDLSWSYFNVLTFGMEDDLQDAIQVLEDMESAAHQFASKTAGWSRNIGMYLHVYGHSSVNAFHLHLVDLDATGPTHDALDYKNLTLQSALEVLRAELAQAKKN